MTTSDFRMLSDLTEKLHDDVPVKARVVLRGSAAIILDMASVSVIAHWIESFRILHVKVEVHRSGGRTVIDKLNGRIFLETVRNPFTATIRAAEILKEVHAEAVAIIDAETVHSQ